ncbi:hypothetical protein ACIQNU_26955 [Streptomyces sp. NPDC091292]|uniref:hypothetical protein n=1 Tax=Streptomyces sp. NPDC091292 TaxID=3365991 RepID=UPI003822A441
MWTGTTVRGLPAVLAVVLLALQLMTPTAPLASAHEEAVAFTTAEMVTCGDHQPPVESAPRFRARVSLRCEDYVPEPPGAAGDALSVTAARHHAPAPAAGSSSARRRPAEATLPSMLQVFRC